MTSLQKEIRRDIEMRIAAYPALSERVEHYSALIPDLKELSAFAREVAAMELALAAIANDPYYSIIELYYFEGKSTAEVGKKLYCDCCTVQRHRRRLVWRMAAILYDIDPAA